MRAAAQSPECPGCPSCLAGDSPAGCRTGPTSRSRRSRPAPRRPCPRRARPPLRAKHRISALRGRSTRHSAEPNPPPVLGSSPGTQGPCRAEQAAPHPPAGPPRAVRPTMPGTRPPPAPPPAARRPRPPRRQGPTGPRPWHRPQRCRAQDGRAGVQAPGRPEASPRFRKAPHGPPRRGRLRRPGRRPSFSGQHPLLVVAVVVAAARRPAQGRPLPVAAPGTPVRPLRHALRGAATAAGRSGALRPSPVALPARARGAQWPSLSPPPRTGRQPRRRRTGMRAACWEQERRTAWQARRRRRTQSPPAPGRVPDHPARPRRLQVGWINWRRRRWPGDDGRPSRRSFDFPHRGYPRPPPAVTIAQHCSMSHPRQHQLRRYELVTAQLPLLHRSRGNLDSSSFVCQQLDRWNSMHVLVRSRQVNFDYAEANAGCAWQVCAVSENRGT